ncbi:two-partner secretion domain-containing protein [Methylocucumis oryzae]|uniref:two-partner secretion domain-containing protein n=1 Tax=Methylocucumis oryzae TaxID=1632867 RepID=UPI000698FC9D|nr:filamentous hemagglutinin N-terminal domain-containing protein [Methylocucumis oryzae]
MNTKRHHAKRGQFSSAMQQPLRRVLNLAILTIIYPAQLLAAPNGADVINGQVTIDTSAPGVMTITNSPNAIIHWQDFNIAKNEILQFIQQNGQSAVLNRVVGGNPSEILGQLISNGKVFLLNPNGIVFGPDAIVDTQGLLASSLNLSDDDFLHGNYHFIAEGKPGSIVNQGIIRVGKEGNVMLIAPTINNSGTISSEGGQITLAAGRKMLVTNLDDPDISFEIQAPKDSVLNLGKILTEGGVISAFAGTITHSGEMNADSVSIDAQGNIVLSASQSVTVSEDSQLSVNNSQGDAGSISIESQQGSVTLAGDISAKASGESGDGGVIKTSGYQVNSTNAKNRCVCSYGQQRSMASQCGKYQRTDQKCGINHV